MDANGSNAFDRQPAESFFRGGPRNLLNNEQDARPRETFFPPVFHWPLVTDHCPLFFHLTHNT
jgi:hypothetical protein